LGVLRLRILCLRRLVRWRNRFLRSFFRFALSLCDCRSDRQCHSTSQSVCCERRKEDESCKVHRKKIMPWRYGIASDHCNAIDGASRLTDEWPVLLRYQGAGSRAAYATGMLSLVQLRTRTQRSRSATASPDRSVPTRYRSHPFWL